MISEFLHGEIEAALELVPILASQFLEQLAEQQLQVFLIQLFDGSIVNETLRHAIASTVRHSIPKTDNLMRCVIELEKMYLALAVPPELCEFLANIQDEADSVRNILEDARAAFLFDRFETRVFCITCLSLLLSGTYRQLIDPSFNVLPSYKARNREWLRHIVWSLYGAQESLSQSPYCDQLAFIAIIEAAIYSALSGLAQERFDVKRSVISLRDHLAQYDAPEENKANPADIYGFITGVQEISQCPSQSSVSSSLLRVAVKVADFLVVPAI